MNKVQSEWLSLKKTIELTRNGGIQEDLLNESESYFTTTNSAVSAAEAYSKGKVQALKIIQILMFCGGAFIFTLLLYHKKTKMSIQNNKKL